MADEDDQAPHKEQGQAPQRAPWTIKGMPGEARRVAMAAARRRGQSMGVWIEAAVRDQVRREEGGDVAPPTKSLALVPSSPPAPTPSSAPTLDAAAVASLLHTYVALAASAKVPADKGLVEEYAALLRDLMRRMREPARDPR